jgi:type II secretory ATPase GspE/PulE/Tfp pilus assembly ATPase PilB-like protein
MDKKSRNIMTLEDPIEYKISHVKQTEILPGVINFADGIKSILRQDPDVILIGEIRDEESAKMAIRASMTGHLVFTTIHANDSFGAIFRLKEFNILNSLIAENLVAIISQRLVKKANGAGRIVVSEILKIDHSITNLIMNNADKLTMKNQALSSGFKSIYDDYLEKLKKNIISEATL